MTRKKRIGIDCRLWNETGVGRYVRNLIYLLPSDNTYEYILFTMPTNYDEVCAAVKGKNVTVIKTRYHWHSWAEQILFPLQLLTYNLDLMHFTYLSFPVFYPRTFIVTIHDMTPWKYATGKASTLPTQIYYLKLLAYKFSQIVGAWRANHIISVSETTKHDIITLLKIDPKKIAVTLLGVDIRAVDTVSTKQQTTMLLRHYGLTSRHYFMTVGNFYPHKNIERLLYAFDLLQKKNQSHNSFW